MRQKMTKPIEMHSRKMYINVAIIIYTFCSMVRFVVKVKLLFLAFRTCAIHDDGRKWQTTTNLFSIQIEAKKTIPIPFF